jgi:hypothetical protein
VGDFDVPVDAPRIVELEHRPEISEVEHPIEDRGFDEAYPSADGVQPRRQLGHGPQGGDVAEAHLTEIDDDQLDTASGHRLENGGENRCTECVELAVRDDGCRSGRRVDVDAELRPRLPAPCVSGRGTIRPRSVDHHTSANHPTCCRSGFPQCAIGKPQPAADTAWFHSKE